MEGGLGRKISELSDLHLRYTYSNTSSSSEFGQYENPSTEQFESRFIRDDELYSDILAQLPEIRNIIFIDHDDVCLYFYQHYAWNIEKLTTLFFNENWDLLKANATS